MIYNLLIIYLNRYSKFKLNAQKEEKKEEEKKKENEKENEKEKANYGNKKKQRK